jgi:tetratricopeptide (TPR) repeat protein
MQGAISDFTALIEMRSAPKEEVACALVDRSSAKGKLGDNQGAISDCTTVIEMEGAPNEQVARALFNRGYAKGNLSDVEGAISDYTAVIKRTGVSNETLARVLFNRGLICYCEGDFLEAMEDLFKVIDLAVMMDDLVVDAANLAYRILWVGKDYSGAKDVVTKLGGVLNTASKDLASATALRFLNRITSPGLKDAWPVAWRVLAETPRPEVAEALQFLEPVCAVLEGKDRAVLDGLPPEQREFAENVLKSFEAKPN